MDTSLVGFFVKCVFFMTKLCEKKIKIYYYYYLLLFSKRKMCTYRRMYFILYFTRAWIIILSSLTYKRKWENITLCSSSHFIGKYYAVDVKNILLRLSNTFTRRQYCLGGDQTAGCECKTARSERNKPVLCAR